LYYCIDLPDKSLPFISSWFFAAKTAFHHCTFSIITAHFMHHCTLKQALIVLYLYIYIASLKSI